MINVTALVQLKAFARQDGLWLALLWVASFLLVVYQPGSSWGSMLALSTPIVVTWLLVRFRNYALDGVISFRRGLAFSCYTFLYASMLFCVAQYVFFRFFDQGAFLAMLNGSIAQMEELYRLEGVDGGPLLENMKTGTEVVGMMAPIELAFVFMMQNIFIGGLLSLPIALIGMRRYRVVKK